ncbi:MAG: hypothetical protein LPJ89_10815, partial [Hymenobacteraceae bacterium]|nr:hypothetical protein [Hymenobacteraceae bacterium]MDX5397023.1 hypothetical protein [Hymenobacteraceae bacterium]MDX5444259.1 hypothetical protein [Hymenobacteraceae bacterium]MDX5513097.1 hypothetical protein [Hymenobacteraceae bacterium]
SGQVKERVGNEVKDAKLAMESDILLVNSDLKKSYNQILQQSDDSTLIIKVHRLYFTITRTSKYIDSLRNEMNKLDEMGTKNVKFVKDIFFNNGVGDSVFYQVRQSYSLAIDIALADTTKSRLKNVRETFSEESKKQFFELNNPLGVNTILYGIESELIKDGTRSLNGYLAK